MRPPRPRRFAGAAALAVCLILLGMGVSAAQGRGGGGVLRLRYWQAPTILNPHLSTGNKDQEASRITYEPLASFDAEGNLVPFLAAEIPSLENGGVAPDGRSVVWKLKPGIFWSDGHPFTARDVKFTFEFIRSPETGAVTRSAYDAIQRIEVLDDFTVKILFAEPTPAWATHFVGTWGMILPRHVFRACAGADARSCPANRAPVGTGPYRVVSFSNEEMILIGDDLVSMVKVVYEPNPHFREPGKPHFDRVELRGGGDVTSAARAVLSEGTADFSWNLQMAPGALSALQESGTGDLAVVNRSFVERLVLNRTDPYRAADTGERSALPFPHPFFRDPRVRRAFAHAVDRDAVAALYGAQGRATTNVLVSPSKFNSRGTIGMYPYDPDRAAALLAEAGWVDGDGDGFREKEGLRLAVVYQTTVNPIRREVQRIIKGNLESIGVDVELRMVDASLFFDGDPENTSSFHHFQADMQEYSIGNRVPDPVVYMSWFTCGQIPGEANAWSGSNDARWCNDDYETLHRRVRAELDPERRREILIQMNDLIVRDVAVIPLVNRANVHGVGRSLCGFVFTPWDASTWNIGDWRRRGADASPKPP